MIENAQAMMCGDCGHREFAIFQSPKGLHVECQKCKDISHLTARATLEIEWDEKSNGCLAPAG